MGRAGACSRRREHSNVRDGGSKPPPYQILIKILFQFIWGRLFVRRK